MKGDHDVHKYRRTFLDKAKQIEIWRCMLPNCSHYVRKEFFIGRMSICWRCGRQFVLSAKNLRQAKPTCCSKLEVKKQTKEVIFAHLLRQISKPVVTARRKSA